LRVGPKSRGSVVGRIPNSGVFVLPTTTSPARRSRRVSSLSVTGVYRPSRKAEPSVNLTPAYSASRSFSKNGTPEKGPSAGATAASARARSNIGVTTALSLGFRLSMRAIAASTSSRGLTDFSRTSAACAVASSRQNSLTLISVAGIVRLLAREDKVAAAPRARS